MRELADRTGGRAAYSSNDLTPGIRRAIDDSRVSYALGYYSTDTAQDGRFRSISIKVNRPHLDLRYRRGYFAERPSDTGEETRRQAVRSAVWRPLDSTVIPIAHSRTAVGLRT